jgi:hypothetical protein
MFSTTEYNNLINIFEENKNKKWDEWLEFHSIFDNQGKLLETKKFTHL